MIVVSNATPLIAFSKLDRLSLLRDLFTSLIIPQAVYEEVVEQAPERPGAAEIRQAEWIQVERLIDEATIDYL